MWHGLVDERVLVGYSLPTMKGRIRILVIVVGLGVIALIGWQWKRDTSAINLSPYPGLVNQKPLEIPEDILVQWEIQRATGLAILKDHPDDLGVLQALATIHAAKGEYGIARRYIERYIELNAINPVGWTILGDIAREMEDYKTAEAAYTKSLTLAVNEQQFAKLESLWRDQFPERYNDIETLYEDAIRLDGQRPSYHTRLARWYAEQERWQEAADQMQVVLQLMPDDEGARLDYAKFKAKIQ